MEIVVIYKGVSFEWSREREVRNWMKHGVSFNEARQAFFDRKRLMVVDTRHADQELRRFCIGKVENKVIMVRFVIREDRIRIFGAGYWRKGKKLYEQKNKIH